MCVLLIRMWDCESPSIYGYGPNVTAGISSSIGTSPTPNSTCSAFHGVSVNQVSGGLSGLEANTPGGLNGLPGSCEGYAGTANSLANFCTNITETDDALKQVRGGGFLAEFERDDEEDIKVRLGEDLCRRDGGGGGGNSCSTSGDISPLGEPGKNYPSDGKSNHPTEGMINGNVSGLWVSVSFCAENSHLFMNNLKIITLDDVGELNILQYLK